MNSGSKDPSSPSFDPFQFVLERQYAHSEIACEPSKDSEQRRETYEQRLRQRFVKFPYLTGMKVAKECHCLILAALLELMWESYSHKNKNPVVYATHGSEISRYTKWRVLRRLEQIGVIKVISRKRKNPLVNLNWLPEK
jgi:ribonucleotide reductase beta subunit family protein with ferritin-like domain